MIFFQGQLIGHKIIIIHTTTGDAVWTLKDGLFCPNQGTKL